MSRWLGVPGIALGFVALVFSAHADATTADATLGDLTFHYEPESWRIVPDGNGLVATCLQEDCHGAIVDISLRDGEDTCTKEAMAAGADRFFPNAGRSYENILPAGRFALVLAQRHVGRELATPEFAYGCVAWQGREYLFAMRPETVGTQTWIGGALHYLVSRATAPEATIETVRIGEVDFFVSTEIWRISKAGDGEAVHLTCRAPTCREPVRFASLSARSPAGACPGPLDRIEDNGGAETQVWTLPAEAPDALTFTIAETFLGCRNYVPPHIEACAVHDDQSYHLSTIGPFGCRGSMLKIPDDALMELLKGARVGK